MLSRYQLELVLPSRDARLSSQDSNPPADGYSSIPKIFSISLL